jgi:hypothetical protein
MANKTKDNGSHGVHEKAAQGRKGIGQTAVQFGRDPKGRKGQYGGAGKPPLIKK